MENHTNKLKIASWNLCLGLINKKDLVSRIINENGIDICALQEIELPAEYDSNVLSFNGYDLITENNNGKIRTGIYIKTEIKYTRMCNLEGQNSGVIIIDVQGQSNVRISNCN